MDIVKTEQARIRKDMLALMNEDNNWYKKEDTLRFKQIQVFGKQLETLGDAYRAITREKFDLLANQGYTLKQIAEEFGVSPKLLRKWRAENNYPVNYHYKT